MNPAGKIVLDIPPKADNPRNSEGAFLDLKDSRILFVYSRFNGNTAEDNAPACLAAVESRDGGETWSEERIIVTAEQDSAENIMSVSMTRMQNGAVGLFYFIRRGFDFGKLHLRRSSDEGRTFGEPVCCIPALGYYVTNNDRVVRLRDGRLIVPAGYHRTVQGRARTQETWDSRSTAIYFYSDDDGATWRESAPCTLTVRWSRTGMQEPGVIELQNGTLYGWARTDVGMQYEMFSNDRGVTWSVPSPSRFSAPASPLSMKRDPATGNLIAVWNPTPNHIARPVISKIWNGGRTPLVLSVSRDDGISWEEPLVLEDDPASGYCYIALHFRGDDLLLGYCAGGNDDGGCLNRLRIRKMPVPR